MLWSLPGPESALGSQHKTPRALPGPLTAPWPRPPALLRRLGAEPMASLSQGNNRVCRGQRAQPQPSDAPELQQSPPLIPQPLLSLLQPGCARAQPWGRADQAAGPGGPGMGLPVGLVVGGGQLRESAPVVARPVVGRGETRSSAVGSGLHSRLPSRASAANFSPGDAQLEQELSPAGQGLSPSQELVWAGGDCSPMVQCGPG